MKTVVVLAVGVVLVSILFCPMVIAQPAIPNDIQIVQPDPSLPKGLSAFLGKWEGTDSNRVDHLYIIENINEEKARAYFWWSCCPGPDTWQKYEFTVIKEGPDKYTLVLHIAPTPRLEPCGEMKLLLKGSDLINTCPGYTRLTLRRATSW